MAHYTQKQHQYNDTNTGATQTITVSGAQSAGSINIVCVGFGDNSSTVTVSDSVNGSYTKAIGPTGNASAPARDYIFYFPNIASCAASTNVITFTFSSSVPSSDLRFSEWSSDLGTSWTLGPTIGAASHLATQTSGTASATTVANSLLIGSCWTKGNINAAGTNWTSIDITSPAGDIHESQIVTATGSYAATCSDNGGPGQAVVNFAAFSAASGGTVSLGSVTMQAALGIRNSPVVVGKMPGVTLQAALGIRNSPVVVGKIPGLTMQALLGIANAPRIAGKLPSVNLSAALGITVAAIGKLLIASVPLQGQLGIRNSPVLNAGQQVPPQMIPHSMWGGGHY